MRHTLAIVVLLNGALISAWTTEPAPRPIAFVGATIETIAGETLQNANLIVRGGTIEAVGKDAKIPGNARVIDAKGLTLMPGLVDPLSRAGMSSITAPPASFSSRGPPGRRGPPDRGAPAAAFSLAADQFYPYQDIYRQLQRSGLTTLALAPSGYGQSVIVRLDPEHPGEMILEPDGYLYVSVRNQTSSLQLITAALDKITTKTATSARPSAPARGGGSRGGKGGPPRPGPRPGPRTDGAAPPTASARPTPKPDPMTQRIDNLWREAAAGKRPLFVNASSAAAIAHLDLILKDHPKLQIVLEVSGTSAYQALKVLKDREPKPKLILTPSIDTLPNNRDRMNFAREAQEAGLEIAFSMTGNLNALMAGQDAPLFPIAYLVHTGLSRKTALEALTLRPAKWIGLDGRIGSLEPEKDANILVFDGDPLDIQSRLTRVMVEGMFVYESE